MTFPERIKALFSKKKLTQKVKDGTMTEADWKEFSEAYKQEYSTELSADSKEYEQLIAQAAVGKQVLDILNSSDEPAPVAAPAAEATTDAPAGEPVAVPEAVVTAPAQPVNDQNVVEMVKGLILSNKTKDQQISDMSQRAAGDNPAGITTLTLHASGPGTSVTHLFGIQHPMFSMDARWNKVAANPAFAAVTPAIDDDEPKFQSAVSTFGRSIQARYENLQREGRLHALRVSSDFTFTTSGLSDAGLGAQYMTRRQDALIAQIMMLDSVASLFNTRYNVQDRELITNAFFSELTQAFQTGAIFKGGMSLQPEFGHVDDLMIKVQFGSMKEIERMYIGYLNSNGSDPIKLGMIEFALLGLYKQAMNEYNKRKIMGIGVKPEAGKAGHYNLGSTGVVYSLIRYIHENKLLPHDAADYATYDSASMLADVKAFIADVRESLPVDLSLEGFSINLNKNHQQWWKACCRTAYGKDIDFTGLDGYLSTVPDESIAIRWIPNMGKTTLMFLEQPGNIQFLENVPGEMFAVKIKEDMEEVKAWSTFKEGTSAAFVGKKFTTLALLTANAYADQVIFMNKPVTALAADATTLDATANFWFKSIANNTAAPAITDITSAVKGVAYILECGSATFATKIAKSGKFAAITEAYTPTAVGDYIMLILNSDGDGFLELERVVGGTRTINTATQPNIPGAR